MARIKLEYIEIAGFLDPNIETGMEPIESNLGKYGILRLRYLHKHKRETCRGLLLTGKLVGKAETIFLYIPVPISTNCRTAYILNTHELNRLIKSSASPSITEIFLVDDEYSVIASNNRQDVIPYRSLVENATKEYNPIDNSTDAYILKSKHDSVSIVAFSDRQTVHGLVNRIFANAYLTLLVISCVGMLITLISMKITYSPIHRLLKKIGGNTSGAGANIKSIEEAFCNTQIKNHELLDKINNYRVAMQKSIFDSVAHSNEKDEKKEVIITNIMSIISLFADEVANSCLQISQVKAFIKENYTSRDFSTVMLSDHFGVSIAYMSFIFKKKADINLSDYVWTLRVKKAKELLADTELSIEEISGMVGYDNSSSFRRKFKGSLGVTPSQYRKKPD